ncbi:EthD family reductase [Roseovarius salis]|uniref:EthD family reductase n=1 Tax=Roseovarius salis TaxID=3376063 RepID=UPI0037C9FD14
MKRVIVNYGMPKDRAAFDAHYRDVHAPLTRAMPHLRSFEVSRGEVVSSDGESPVYATAILSFDNQEDLDASMASTEGHAAVQDLDNFATGGVTILTIDAEEQL